MRTGHVGMGPYIRGCTLFTWQQISRYETPAITDEGSAARVKDLQIATYAMVGVDNMVKGMDSGREQAFGKA